MAITRIEPPFRRGVLRLRNCRPSEYAVALPPEMPECQNEQSVRKRLRSAILLFRSRRARIMTTISGQPLEALGRPQYSHRIMLQILVFGIAVLQSVQFFPCILRLKSQKSRKRRGGLAR